MKPTIQHQGKVIVEPLDGGFIVMFPNGEVQYHNTKKQVETSAKYWFKQHLSQDIGVGEIEWRDS